MRVLPIAYNFTEAARLIGVSRVTMYKLRKLGKIPVCQDEAYHGILHEDLVAYLKSIRKSEPSITA